MTGWPWRLRHSFGDFFVLVDNRERYVSDACVEGHDDEWREIATALRQRSRYSAKRCAVHFEDGSALFRSPRNTMGRAARLPIGHCDEMANLIEAALAEPREDDGYDDE